MNITVYLGANVGNDHSLKKAVADFGTWIGKTNNTLVYGGSRIGLMGVIAENALKSKAKVIGVEPRFFVEKELQNNDLSELIVTENMSERKAKMIELGDAFVAFPGGTGTLEEISEIMSMVSLNHTNAPCIIFNLHGYYDGLKVLLDKMIEMDLSSIERQKGIYFVSTLEEVEKILTSEKI